MGCREAWCRTGSGSGPGMPVSDPSRELPIKPSDWNRTNRSENATDAISEVVRRSQDAKRTRDNAVAGKHAGTTTATAVVRCRWRRTAPAPIGEPCRCHR